MFARRRASLLLTVFVAALALTRPGQAALNFYYDPVTGTVAMDTSQTRSGETFSYNLALNPTVVPFSFRYDNFIDLFGSGIVTTRSHQVGATTLSNPARGYFTIGEILPPGLTGETWSTLLAHYGSYSHAPGSHSYVDIIGGGAMGLGPVPPADFFYGLLDRDFDNKWDVVDPDTLTWASHVALIYRPHNGELLIDTTGPGGGHITSVLLKSDGQFLPAGFAPFVDGPLVSASSDSVAVFADAITPGRHSLGQILPPDLSLEAFEASITEARFISRAGFDRPTYDFENSGQTMTLAYLRGVPEPTSLALGLLAAVAGVGATRSSFAFYHT